MTTLQAKWLVSCKSFEPISDTVFSRIDRHVLISEGVLSIQIQGNVLICECKNNFRELPQHTEFRYTDRTMRDTVQKNES